MTRIEQLNSITRFCIYFLILAYISKKSDFWIQMPILIIIFIYILFTIYDNDDNGKLTEFNKTNQSDQFDQSDQMDKINQTVDKIEGFSSVDSNIGDETDMVDKYKYEKKIILEAGQYDENNKLVTAKYKCSKCDKKKKDNELYSYDKYEEYLKNTCRSPTPANPFMNPTVNDFGSEMPPKACNIEDDEIIDDITTSFNKDLFMDVSDLYERQNSQRQFYSIPGSSYPDTINFANWLYSPESTCKINQSKCSAFEDIRYNR